MTRHKQPRLRFSLMEFHGRAETATGDVWWHSERMEDGTVRRTPLVPVEPREMPTHEQDGDNK